MTQTANDIDDQLIREHLAGSGSAFRRLVDRHGPGLIGVLDQMLGDPHLAQDLAQEVFIKLHATLPRYRFKGRFRSLIYAMALNRGRDELRARKRQRLVLIREEHRIAPDHTGRLARREAVEMSIKAIDEPFRSALYMRDVVGLSYREVAAAMGCNLGTVKSRVNRGRLAFRRHYLGTPAVGGDQAKEEHHAS